MCHEVKALCGKGEEKTNIKYSIPYKNNFIERKVNYGKKTYYNN